MEKQMLGTTKEQRDAWRRERALLKNPIERIAFDNEWIVGGVPRGLVLMASEEEDCRNEEVR